MRRLVLASVAVALMLFGVGCGAPQPVTLVAEFADVGDLVVRANVQQSDAVVGTIVSIDLDQERDWLARVTMRLEPETPVPVGTRAWVRSTSLLGEKFVDLMPPPDVTAATPNMPDGAVLGPERTGKAPELEDVFQELGAILVSGGLEDLGAFITASAMIVEGQEENIGRVIDGTANLLSSLSNQREVLGEALELLASSSATLAEGGDTIDRFLDTTDDVARVLAAQRGDLDEAVVQLDRLGDVSRRLMVNHRGDLDRQIKALLAIVPQVHQARGTLSDALAKLPDFTRLFAAAVPGDYIQLDVQLESALDLPIPVADRSAGQNTAVGSILWSAAR